MVAVKLAKLSQCLRPDEVIQVPFAGEVDGAPVEVTAVLDRTAVYRVRVRDHDEMKLVRHDQVLVDRNRMVFKALEGMAAMYARGRKRGKLSQQQAKGDE